MTNTKQTASLDDLVAYHTKQAEEPSRDDVYEAAKLFNAVGSQLMGIDKMNVGDGPPAMKLNKQAILNEQQSQPAQAHFRSPPPPATPPPPPMQTHSPAPTSPVITIDVNTYNKQLKKVETLTKKMTKLEKDFAKTLDIINVEQKTCKYKLVTDDIEMTCRDTCSLLSVIANQINSKTANISITKC